MTADDERSRREAIVREHMESENRHDFDATIATFSHPRYELMASGEVFDGEAEVRAYFARSRTAFPDQRNELRALRHTDDAVIVEFDLLGTVYQEDHRSIVRRVLGNADVDVGKLLPVDHRDPPERLAVVTDIRACGHDRASPEPRDEILEDVARLALRR